MANLFLKNGSFYDSTGAKVPLEFGNKEQIKLLVVKMAPKKGASRG